jgi:hypothetical protein
MRPGRLTTLGLFLVVAASTGSARAAETLALGRSFVAKDPSFGVINEKRRVSAKGQTPAGGFAIFVDPTVDGATLTVETDDGAQTFTLPAAAWRPIRNGFGYTDPDGMFGATKRLTVKTNSQGVLTLKVSLSGAHAPLAVLPPNPGTEAAVGLAIAGETYCIHFGGVAGGVISNDGNRKFRVQHPDALGPCPSSMTPPPPGP